MLFWEFGPRWRVTFEHGEVVTVLFRSGASWPLAFDSIHRWTATGLQLELQLELDWKDLNLIGDRYATNATQCSRI
jgi:hypothetical protein